MISRQLLSFVKNNFDYSPESVFIKDKEYSYQYLNPSITKQINLQLNINESFLNLTDFDIYPNHYAKSYITHDQLAMKEDIYYQLDVIPLPDNSSIFNLCYKTPLKESNGTTCGVLGFSRFLNYEKLLFTLKNRGMANLKISVPCLQVINKSFLLTSRELDVIKDFLSGKSTKRIAQSLDIAEITVNFHLNNIKEKWKCLSKEDIFSNAFQKGLIGFSGFWDLINFLNMKKK